MPKVDPSLSVAERVDAACDSFEREWRAGLCPSVGDYVAAAPESDRDALRSALAAVEAELKARRATGETAVSQESVGAGSESDPGPTIARPMDQAAVPNRIGRFEIRTVLGTGAFGCVYRAFDPSLDREVAIKVPLASTLRTPEDRERFEKEAKAAAAIEHPNICRIHEVGEHEGQPYIVMALVPGRSLAEVLRGRKEPLAEKQVAFIVRKLALALEAAHKKGVVHRDLKPANVMWDKEEKQLVVMDFGLARKANPGDARATQTGIVMGTPAYMSPEQARGAAKDVGPEGDIFSLGVIMYEMLTNTRPFSGTPHEVIGQILLLDPETPSERRPGVNPQLEAICLKALAKDPANRFASMKEFATALDGYLRPIADPLDETARAAETTEREGEPLPLPEEEGLSTNTRKLAEVFEAISEERKLAKAETARAVEEAVAKHRTPLWRTLAVIAALLLVGGGIIAALFLLNKEKPAQPQTVQLVIKIEGLNFNDPNLTFAIDDKPYTADQLSKEVDLALGEHRLTVYRGGAIHMYVTFTVTGGAEPKLEDTKVTPVQPPPPPPPKVEPKVTPVDANAGFVEIFNGKDLTGWSAGANAKAFRVESGLLIAKSNPTRNETFCLLTEKEYGDYVLRFEFQFDKPQPTSSHSSVAIRSGPEHAEGRGCRLEVQLRDTAEGSLGAGALIFVQGSEKKPITPVGDLAPGTWHTVEIEFRDRRVKVTLNGKLVNDVDLSKFTGFRNHFQKEVDRKKGHIGLQSYREETKFRNIRVKELTATVPETPIVSNFEKDEEGWAVAGDARSKPTHHKTGGNPGGYLSAVDSVGGDTWYWVAPAKFLGDRSASYGKTLSFDLAQSSTKYPYEDDDVILEGEKLTLVFKLPKHPDTKWTSYKVPLTAKGWKVKATGKEATEDELKAVLKSLKRLWIRGEYQEGPDSGKLDNVVLEQQSGGMADGLPLRNWKQEGPAGSRWVLAADGKSVVVTESASPTFFIGPDEQGDVTFRCKLRVEPPNATVRNEAGLVLGYRAPLAEKGHPAGRFEFLLLEWTNALTVPSTSGFYLKRINGDFAKEPGDLRIRKNEARMETLGHVPGGWEAGKDHDLEVRYEPTRVRVSLDGKPLFDVQGKFAPGRFGFYNFGLPGTTYSVSAPGIAPAPVIPPAPTIPPAPKIPGPVKIPDAPKIGP